MRRLAASFFTKLRNTPFRIYFSVLLSAGVVLGMVGCFRKQSPSRRYYGTTKPLHAHNELWTNLGTEPEYIDPNLTSGSPGGVVVRSLFAGLTQAHPATLQPMPDIAEYWHTSDDGRTYTFFLRESLWSDGAPLTADDFAFSWRRILDPKTASKYMTYLHVLDGAEHFSFEAIEIKNVSSDTDAEAIRKFFEPSYCVEKLVVDSEEQRAFVYIAEKCAQDGAKSKLPQARGERHRQVVQWAQAKASAQTELGWDIEIANAETVGIRVLDPHVFQVRLNAPVPYFLQMVNFYVVMPVPQHLFVDMAVKGIKEANWTRPEYIVSNGAYTLSEHQFRHQIVLRKNPRYWDLESVAMPTIRLWMVENYNTTLNLYKTGQFDWIGENSKLPPEAIPFLRHFEDFSLVPFYCVYFYWFNVKEPPVDDVRVRQALSLAVDRQDLVETILRQDQEPTASLVPDNMLADYEGIEVPIYDPEKARRLLAEAGYPNGQGFPKLTLKYNTSEGHKQVAIAVQAMWKEILNVDVTIENQEWGVYLKTLKDIDFQVGRMGWIGDYMDPITFLELVKGTNENNHSNWKNAAYDTLIDRSFKASNPAERQDILRQAEAMVSEELPVMPIYFYTRSDLRKPYLKGIWDNAQNRIFMKYAMIDMEGTKEVDPPPLGQPKASAWMQPWLERLEGSEAKDSDFATKEVQP